MNNAILAQTVVDELNGILVVAESKDLDVVKNKIKETLDKAHPGYDELKAACAEFVRKCNSGEARSVRSSAQMRNALQIAGVDHTSL